MADDTKGSAAGKSGSADLRTAMNGMLAGASRAALIGGLATRAFSIAAIKTLTPVLAAYARQQDSADESASGGGLNDRDLAALKGAGSTALLELIEISSVTNPIFAGAPAYHRYDAERRFQPPHMMHLMALVMAAQAALGQDRASAQQAASGKDDSGNAAAVPPAPGQTVAYLAVAPGEYAAVSGPVTPPKSRRSAMRERSYNSPNPAMLARRANPLRVVSAPRGAQAAMMASGGSHQAAGYAASAQANPYAMRQPGCPSCGGSSSNSCTCHSAGGSRQFPPARYKDDGSCASVLKVSCDTQWRIRECLKIALCDLIRCLGTGLCEDGKFASSPDPDYFTNCLEGFACSLLACLPDAICPPPLPPEICCEPLQLASCDCNFAVGE
jgi:hypothetical protein